jgi:hypothetical protein
MKNLRIIATLIFAAITTMLIGQNYSIIHIEGDAFAYTNVDGKEKYSKLVYGPLTDCEKIVVKNNALVKVLGEDKRLSILNKEGEYAIASLQFNEVEGNSIFNRFCNYFHAFFVNHASSESKANYENNIYAISRGNLAAPSLDFPMEGMLPADAGSLPFIWTHDCDSCEYIFNINDMESRELIYTMMTEEKQVLVENPMKYFSPGKEYYWSVKIVGQDLEYEVIPFTVSPKGDYDNSISVIRGEIDKSMTQFTAVAKMVFVMGELGYDQANYAIYYGLGQCEKYPKDDQMRNLFERFWYDSLMEK